jgi:hypothetical protein
VEIVFLRIAGARVQDRTRLSAYLIPPCQNRPR